MLPASSCGSRHVDGADGDSGVEIRFAHSRLLRASDCGTYRRVDVVDPWDTTRLLHTYILVDSGTPDSGHLPEGTVVGVPLRRSIVYSSVHQRVFDMLDACGAIAGVCDAEYVSNPALLAGLSDGSVADCGNNMSPTIEKIVAARPDAVVLSPYETSGNYGKLGNAGIPIVECADYMEASPLGRAEWIRFFGMLLGRETEADSIFAATEQEYLRLKKLASSTGKRPTVLVDGIYGQGWSVPPRMSTTAHFINDAGGRNPFDYLDGAAGTTPLSPEQVLSKARDADLWLFRYYQKEDMTLAQMERDHPVYSRFEAFANGRVLGCNTARVAYYEEVPFNPHLLLAELTAIFHPELVGKGAEAPGRYFTPLNH